jgi:hypothetical protein
MAYVDPYKDPNAPLRTSKAGWSQGLSGPNDEASDHATDPQVDMSLNDLHTGVGQVCPICNRAIAAGQAVRKRVDGSYQHDSC